MHRQSKGNIAHLAPLTAYACVWPFQSTSALTLSVAANAKQVLLIILATAVFGTHVNMVNGAGIVVVLAGSARYSQVVYQQQQQAALRATKG